MFKGGAEAWKAGAVNDGRSGRSSIRALPASVMERASEEVQAALLQLQLPIT